MKSIKLFLIILAVLLPWVLMVTFEMASRNKPYPGVKLSNAVDVIRQKTVTLTWIDEGSPRSWELKILSINPRIDWDKTRAKLLAVGRSGDIISDLKVKISALIYGLTLDPALAYDDSSLDEFVSLVASQIDLSTIQPKFRLANGRVTEFNQGVPGRKVDTKLLTDQILSTIFSDSPRLTVDIPVSIQNPSRPVGETTAESLGIKNLLGKGISTYKGSIPGRKSNIALTASRLDGILVPPETIFSFNDAVGDVNQETGYKEAYVIKDGKTVLGDGGGVCQDSTTLFRAVLNAGLPVTERRAHSYRVSYYEQNSPPGFDATVYSPTTDFKFKNDTPAYILIQAKADNSASVLTVELWGISDGRTARTTKPIVADQVPPPPDLYQDDPGLPAGTIKQVDWKAWGAKVKFDYIVSRDGEVIYQKTFISNYRPWQAVFLRGTGG